ncbi:MAG: AAA family ATPase [Candidatus Aenigmarchaeota archaeon]|nr:AAA family ATPase [Candidatus Aenigmarchaeota archaeon]
MKVIGVIGLIGAGKDSANEYIMEQYDYRLVHFGDIVREIAKKMNKEPNRDNLLAIQREYTKKHGIDYFAKEVVKRIEKGGFDKVIINGIRRPVDASVPKQRFGKSMILLQVDADPKIRFERMSKRGRVGDPKTFGEFRRQENAEAKAFDFKDTLKLVDYKVTNNGTLEELHKQIDKLLEKTGFD